MFFVFNKSKIYSYLVSLGTVALLLVMGFYITNNKENTIQTSANSISEKQNNIINDLKNNIEKIK